MIEVIETWIFETLIGDDALMTLLGEFPLKRVRAGEVDRGQDWPNVAFYDQSPGEEESSRCGDVELSRLPYVVKVVGRGVGIVGLQPFWDRFDALLTGAADTDGTFRWNVVREAPVRVKEVMGSDRFTHYGATWTFEIRSVT